MPQCTGSQAARHKHCHEPRSTLQTQTGQLVELLLGRTAVSETLANIRTAYMCTVSEWAELTLPGNQRALGIIKIGLNNVNWKQCQYWTWRSSWAGARMVAWPVDVAACKCSAETFSNLSMARQAIVPRDGPECPTGCRRVSHGPTWLASVARPCRMAAPEMRKMLREVLILRCHPVRSCCLLLLPGQDIDVLDRISCCCAFSAWPKQETIECLAFVATFEHATLPIGCSTRTKLAYERSSASHLERWLRDHNLS